MTDDGKKEDSSIKIILIVTNTDAKCQQEKLRLHCLQGGWSLSLDNFTYIELPCVKILQFSITIGSFMMLSTTVS